MTEHACGIVGDHVGRCGDCGAENVPLGWAHVCRPCWDTFITLGLSESDALDENDRSDR